MVAGLGVLLVGCDLEVLNPGSIVDENLNEPELMPVVVNGVSAEFNQIQDNLSYNVARLTDDLSGTGSYFDTGRFRRGLFDNEDSGGQWADMHEAAWAAGEAWSRMQQVLQGGEETSVDAAKLFAIMGHAHRTLGENFCSVVYDVGSVQPRTAAFDSAIVAFDRAIAIGAAAGSGADQWVTAAHAGKAQAYVGLGDWANAAASAAQVPSTYVHSAIFNVQANSNIVWLETHGRAEMGVWGSPALSYGDPAGMNDPRTPYTVCGTWNDPNDPDAGVTSTNVCTAHQGADGLTAHYRQEIQPEEGSDIPVATGAEMRLIEAENYLVNGGTMAQFIGKINEARAVYGLPGLPAPATAGALEYPNTMDVLNGGSGTGDDAWSILDRERYMTLWIQGRRLWDLHRWSHPFLNGHQLVGTGAPDPRVSCMPIPEDECEVNTNITDAPECQG